MVHGGPRLSRLLPYPERSFFLLGPRGVGKSTWLNARRPRAHPKFFWFDAGVARAAAGLLHDTPDRTWLGFALETLVCRELRVYNHVARRNRPIAYCHGGGGQEIDFVIETKKLTSASPPRIVCIEVTLADTWRRAWGTPMRSLDAIRGVVVERMIGVYAGERSYHYDGVDVLPVKEFLRQLHGGRVF